MSSGSIKRRHTDAIRNLVKNMTESATACLVTMVQGNVLELGVGHWVVACQTGIFAGILTTIALYIHGSKNRWVAAGCLGLATAVVDYLVHPSGFGPDLAEPMVTGMAAAGLSLLVASRRLTK